jgi:hypothetical protein
VGFEVAGAWGGARGKRYRRLFALALAIVAGGVLAYAQLAPAEVEVPGCDPIDPAVCLQPFPNDYFTVADPSTPTGRRLNLPLAGMPRNAAGKPIDPTDINRSDGFSPGEAIVTRVPGLDNVKAFERTGAVPITNMAKTYEPEQPVVVIDASTLKRQLIWSEIDSAAKKPEDRNLFVRPARNWQEGHRYIVALRNLKNENGETIQPSEAFRDYRDNILQPLNAKFEERRPHMEGIFATLERAGIARGDLFLAWDFTVESEKSIADRMLAIRNDAFAQLGDTNLADLKVAGNSPQFEVESVKNFTKQEDPNIAREVRGTVTVPCYLDGGANCDPGQQFVIGENGLPERKVEGTWKANFICHIPRVALEGAKPPRAQPSLYGHGLFGSAEEVNQLQLKTLGEEHDFLFCATNWIGMSSEDLETTIGVVIPDLSNFPMLVDRTMQGWLDAMYVGRAMIHLAGFSSNPAFQLRGRSVINTQRLFYDGNSQGGILGGGLTAVAPDFNRAVLGVPAMNFSTLLNRSTDFYGKELTEAKGTGELSFSSFLFQAYPNELERPLIYDLLQILWDRSEANGYAEHLTSNPLPDTPVHKVLMHVAFGDHQVATVAADVEARTIGAAVPANPLEAGRSPDVEPYYAIARIPSFPYSGSAMVIWDGGTPAPPTTNTPPTYPEYGYDPHEFPRNDRAARQQVSDFLQATGKVTDVCNNEPCKIDFNPEDGWTGGSNH